AILSRDAFLRLLPALQNHPRVTFGKATRATISSAALRPELLVESRGEGGIAVKCNFPSNALLLWNATDAWLLQNNEFVRCGEALPAGSTHLIERPLLLDGDRALHFLAFDLPRLRDAFDVRAGEGVRLPEIATAGPAFELRLGGALNSLTAQVEKWTGEIERVTPKLEIVGSGQDWFEVRYSLTTPGGEVFSNADIQRLLRSGQSQTRLKNGHLAVIDTAGLEDFEQVIRDCDPAQTRPGLYRISRAHAGYVEQTARELGSAVADRREALKKFITG